MLIIIRYRLQTIFSFLAAAAAAEQDYNCDYYQPSAIAAKEIEASEASSAATTTTTTTHSHYSISFHRGIV
jgi:hypothetical protein